MVGWLGLVGSFLSFFFFLPDVLCLESLAKMKGYSPIDPSERLMHGVAPKDKGRYSTYPFVCDGKELNLSQINDEYCDCLYGDDEPGTSACEKGKFWCEEDKKYIPSSMVSDGIADCKQGTDEKYCTSELICNPPALTSFFNPVYPPVLRHSRRPKRAQPKVKLNSGTDSKPKGLLTDIQPRLKVLSPNLKPPDIDALLTLSRHIPTPKLQNTNLKSTEDYKYVPNQNTPEIDTLQAPSSKIQTTNLNPESNQNSPETDALRMGHSPSSKIQTTNLNPKYKSYQNTPVIDPLRTDHSLYPNLNTNLESNYGKSEVAVPDISIEFLLSFAFLAISAGLCISWIRYRSKYNHEKKAEWMV